MGGAVGVSGLRRRRWAALSAVWADAALYEAKRAGRDRVVSAGR